MAKSRSPLVIIFITVLIDLIGFGIVIPVLPLYSKNFGASETVTGLLLAVYSLMNFIFSPIWGRLSDRIGRRPVLFFSIIGTAFGFLVMGLANTILLLFVGRIIDGITGGNISTAQAYIADITPQEQRSRSMGFIGAAFGLGFIFGPALGGVLSHISLAAPFLFSAGLAAANSIALYFFLPESLSAEHRHAARSTSFAQLYKEAGNWQVGAIFATYFFGTIAFAMLTATYSLFTSRRFHLDATHNGYIFAVMGVIGALVQGIFLGRFIKVLNEKLLIVLGAALLALGMFILPLSYNLRNLFLASAAIALGNSLLTPVLNGLASKSVGPAWQGRILGVLQSVASLARIIGPALGGWLLMRDAMHDEQEPISLDIYGYSPFWTAGVIMLIAFCVSLTLQSSKSKAVENPVQQEG